MADKRIQDLTPATSVETSDRFVLEQNGQAKSLTGQILINDLATALDGHGGISDITYTAPSSGSLVGTLTITLADNTVETFSVTNGKGIVSIAKTGTSDLVDTYTITYNNGDTSTFDVTNGEKGDTGDADHVYFAWSATEPDSDSDMSNIPDAWIGVATTTSDTAPSHYTDYAWYEYKGEIGDTGNGIVSVTFESSSGLVDTYKVLFTDGTYTTFNVTNGSNISSIAKTSTSGLTDTYTVTLTNGDTTTFNVVNGKSISSITAVDVTHVAGHTDVYRINYNDGDSYTFSIYNGTNGTGSVSTVDDIPSDNQNVPLLILGSGAPTTSTVGILKQRYFDQTNSVLYICTGVDTSGLEASYTWSGAGVTVDNALSTQSTNPVQNAVLTALLGLDSLNTTAQTLTGAVNELKADMSGFTGNIADEYDATATYAVGDLCIYDSTLYRCNTAITIAEAWNSLHWTQTAVSDEIAGIESEIGTTPLPTTAQTLTGAIAEHETDLSGKVSKSGDTMTGNLEFSNDKYIYLDTNQTVGVAPSTTAFVNPITFRDANNVEYGFVRGRFATDGTVGMQFGSSINGVNNLLQLGVESGGTRKVVVTNATPWLSALGLGTSGALPITVAQGGTGATTADNARINLGFSTMQAYNKTIANNASWAVDVASGTHGFFLMTGAGNAVKGIYAYNCQTNGIVSYLAIGTAPSGISVSTATNKITLANSGGANCYVLQITY